MKKLIDSGAEALLYRDNWHLVKDRISKSYRLKEIDEKIRKSRTRSEKKLLEKANKIINTPKILDNNSETVINMEFINGIKLSDKLDFVENRDSVCVKIGEQAAVLHNNEIIHGDLTTSNMILKNNKVYFVDFGLGFVSSKVEDMAVDLYLLKQAMESKHFIHFEDSFKSVLKGYKKCKKYNEVLERLKKVEKRGRYK